ncbi:DNA-processing protein DprA [Collinsella vaginalis]|uniref:DNA-processing protein DprA n=1 Tax=Collinsella vaginalis TaxID=1870987 RepID=UPI000A26781A|nr:DNA-processing protein DprA [Collinsella vaginalis]
MPADCIRHELAIDDERYPASVRELPDAPPVLYVRGDPAMLSRPSLSIVGARSATPYGTAVAEMGARIAAQSGLVVVSGGARGCDQAAGAAALDAGGVHVVVLGCGADIVYPRSSAPLIERALAGGGAVVSLDPWGMEPRRWAFPRRNRVIAALSAALLVTEAGLPSGTFSTAECAVELGRELLAIPGSILSAGSRGSNHLIASGATCIADEEELEMAISRIYGLLRFSRPEAPGTPGVGAVAQQVLDALAASPLRMEEIACVARLDVPQTLQFTSELMVQGLVERLIDGRVSLTKRALHARTPLGHTMMSAAQ